MHLHL